MALGEQPPSTEGIRDYDSEDGTVLAFDYKANHDFEIVGGCGLHLWASPEAHDEMDLFVGLTKLDNAGQPIGFRFYSTFSEGPMALGWLRASHREQAAGSSEMRPLYTHTNKLPLIAGDYVELDVEIWPVGSVIRKGETLRLLIGGRDLHDFSTGAPELGHSPDNRGVHRIRSSADQPSYLTLPIRRISTGLSGT